MIFFKDLNRPLTPDEVDANFAELASKIHIGTDYHANLELDKLLDSLEAVKRDTLNTLNNISKINTELEEIRKRVTRLENR